MRCPTCHRKMLALFTSYVCDYCDGLKSVAYHEGYVVWDPADPQLPREEYVFPSEEAATKHLVATQLGRREIRQVFAEEPFRWQRGRGIVADLELADRRYEIHSDQRFEPAPNRAFLSPL